MHVHVILLLLLMILAVIGIIAADPLHELLFPRDDGSAETRDFLEMAAFMLGGRAAMILIMALLVMTIMRPLQRLAHGHASSCAQ